MNGSVFALAALLLGSCHSVLPGPAASAAQRAELHRVDRVADVGVAGNEDERLVSALYSADVGEAAGYRILYVHGTPGEAEGWADFLVEPVAGLPSVALDRPGFGESDHCTLANLQAQAEALEPFLELGRRTVLVGHSYGGPVVLQAAVDYPDRVAGVVVMAGSVAPELENLHWYNYMAKAIGPVLPKGFARANQEVWPLREQLEELARRLGEIKVPVRVVHGTGDGLVPFANAEYMKATLTGAPSVIVDRLDGAGHMFIWEEKWIPHARGAIEGLVREDLGYSN